MGCYYIKELFSTNMTWYPSHKTRGIEINHMVLEYANETTTLFNKKSLWNSLFLIVTKEIEFVAPQWGKYIICQPQPRKGQCCNEPNFFHKKYLINNFYLTICYSKHKNNKTRLKLRALYLHDFSLCFILTIRCWTKPTNKSSLIGVLSLSMANQCNLPKHWPR